MTKIHLITMGGTIDSEPYSEKPGEYPAYATMPAEPLSPQTLRQIFQEAGNGHVMDWSSVCMKDSKTLNSDDFALLLSHIDAAEQSGASRIVVTLGTDRMCETARLVMEQKPSPACPIVFTGAIWPLTNGDRSDGPGNLRLASFHETGPGVFIAMGDVFAPPDKVKKDFTNRTFVTIPDGNYGPSVDAIA